MLAGRAPLAHRLAGRLGGWSRTQAVPADCLCLRKDLGLWPRAGPALGPKCGVAVAPEKAARPAPPLPQRKPAVPAALHTGAEETSMQNRQLATVDAAVDAVRARTPAPIALALPLGIG